ncbi:MAG: chloride channel protein [Bryobacteraceae bacterium]
MVAGAAIGLFGAAFRANIIYADGLRLTIIGTTRTHPAACAGAGLAVAFNASVGGSVFVFEELATSFTHDLLVATLGAATVAVAVMRALLGNRLDFLVRPGEALPQYTLVFFLVLGIFLGALGALYNATILAALNFCGRFVNIPTVARAALIGAGFGLLSWFHPNIAGSDEAVTVTQGVFSNWVTVGTLPMVFLARFLIGPWSYAALTPGGLFSPLLLVGATFGALFAAALNYVVPTLGLPLVSFAVVGMVALFAASVCAPLTGIVLAVEMTGRGDLILAMLAAALGAMVVATLLKSPPIYVSLEDRTLAAAAPRSAAISVFRRAP